MNLINLVNWPNAKVANTTLIDEFIPQICQFPRKVRFNAEGMLTQIEGAGKYVLLVQIRRNNDERKADFELSCV